MNGNAFSEAARPELFFALVGAAGVNLDHVCEVLEGELESFGYTSDYIRLSDLLENVNEWVDDTTRDGSLAERIKYRQKMGNYFRELLQNGDALARAGIAAIREKRASITQSQEKIRFSHAYILRQLKHPSEVDLLREVYTSSFFVIACHAPVKDCKHMLAQQMAREAFRRQDAHLFEPIASEIISTDQNEGDEFGQNVRDTYPKADLFVDVTSAHMRSNIGRFIDLLFGHPFHSPYPGEYAMYHANAVSLRSSDDNRQVGAIIFNIDDPYNSNNVRKADVIAVGTNEVPRGGGELYWNDASPDARDQSLIYWANEDRAKEIKVGALAELIEKLKEQHWLDVTLSAKTSTKLAEELMPKLKGTQFRDIMEFSRPVHAEMAALIDAARRGVSIDGLSMYVTTFPCHNCAKHLIAAGIRRVVYLEPYPKSRAHDLYREEINVEATEKNVDPYKVNFFAYAGVAPRLYQQLFSISDRGAKKGRPQKRWEAEKSSLVPPYVPRNACILYLAAELDAINQLNTSVYHIPSESPARQNSGEGFQVTEPPPLSAETATPSA